MARPRLDGEADQAPDRDLASESFSEPFSSSSRWPRSGDTSWARSPASLRFVGWRCASIARFPGSATRRSTPSISDAGIKTLHGLVRKSAHVSVYAGLALLVLRALRVRYAVPLLRALQLGDVERARDLGALELVEEDVAALSQACLSNSDYGRLLRIVLDQLEAGR